MYQKFARIAAISPRVNVADVDFNVTSIIGCIENLAKENVEIAVFPEMCITGYTCGDLFRTETLIHAAAMALDRISKVATQTNVDVVVGLPVSYRNTLYNCAAVIRGSHIDLIAKTYIPNYGEFYEKRWWQAPIHPDEPVEIALGKSVATLHLRPTIIDCHGVKIGVEICEDLWVPIPPSCRLALAGAMVICNLSASDDTIGKYQYLTSLIEQQSARTLTAYVYSGAGFGESSTDLTFDGKAIIAENGKIMAQSARWTNGPKVSIADIDIAALAADRQRMTTFADCAAKEVTGTDNIDICIDTRRDTTWQNDLKYRAVAQHPFVPADDNMIDRRCDEIINIQVAGLSRRLSFINCTTLVIGISGGLDSTLALLVAVKAFDRLKLDRKGIIGVTMPGFGTTHRTKTNAVTLMEQLGITIKEIPIDKAVRQHFSDIGQDPELQDVTYENSQARYRTMLLMNLSNKLGGIVLGTGDLSELALGWATYNGDHMSMYGVNAGVPKTLVRYLVRYFARNATSGQLAKTLEDIIETPVSPELIPADKSGNITQKTEDLVGPYELHDFYLYYMLRYGFAPRRVFKLAMKAFDGTYDRETILRWMKVFYRRFFNQQFKRSCMPDGPKVGSVCLSPRGDWRMPSDASSRLWLIEAESLN